MVDRRAPLAHLLVVAGGGGERLGGVDKALSVVGGRRLIDNALGIPVTGRRLVVRPSDRHPIGRVSGSSALESVAERPAGGGPAAGMAAAVEALRHPRGGGPEVEPVGDDATALVVVLAADHLAPLDAVVAELVTALQGRPERGVAVAAPDGKAQWLTAVWRYSALVEAVGALGPADGASAKALTSHGMALLVELPRVASLDDADDLWAVAAGGSDELGVAGPMPAQGRIVDALAGDRGLSTSATVDPDGHPATLLAGPGTPPGSSRPGAERPGAGRPGAGRPGVPWVFVGPPTTVAVPWADSHLVPLEP